MYFIQYIVYRFFKLVIYAFQPFGCKVNSINKTIYLSIYLSISSTGLIVHLALMQTLPVSDSKIFTMN